MRPTAAERILTVRARLVLAAETFTSTCVEGIHGYGPEVLVVAGNWKAFQASHQHE